MEIKKMIINMPKDIHRELKRIAVVNDTTMTGIIMMKIGEVIEQDRVKVAGAKENVHKSLS